MSARATRERLRRRGARAPALAALAALALRPLEARAQGAREAALEALAQGFPYRRFDASYAAGRLLYVAEHGDEASLRQLALDPEPSGILLDLRRGTPLGEREGAVSTLREARYLPAARRWALLADGAHDERYRVRLYDLAGRPAGPRGGAALDDAGGPGATVLALGANDAGSLLLYVLREGPPGASACLYARPAGPEGDATPPRRVYCDTPALRFTWGSIEVSPDDAGAVLRALADGDRGRENLLWVPLTDGAPPRLLTDATRRRRGVAVVRGFVGPRRFFYSADDDGYVNAYERSLEHDATPRAVTRFERDADALALLSLGGAPRLLLTLREPQGTRVVLVAPETGEALASVALDARASLLDAQGDRALFALASRASPFELRELRASADGHALTFTPRASVPDELARALERCRSEPARFETFDVDPATGAPRVLDAYLEVPREGPLRGAVVEGFYGGDNHFDLDAQARCAAGVATLSPAVRGSSGRGAAFAALNDGDLGGAEQRDLAHAARFVQRRLGLGPSRVGVVGVSHGGYEALRALSLPRGALGATPPFAWGFGVAYAPITDLLEFYATTGIPEWVLLEAGDPRVDAARLRDRSPLAHAARVRAPVLLLHGALDARVPVAQSRAFYAAVRGHNARARYVELPAQGHLVQGAGARLRAWREELRFYDAVLPSRARAGRWLGRGALPRRALRALALAALVLGLAGAARALGLTSRR